MSEDIAALRHYLRVLAVLSLVVVPAAPALATVAHLAASVIVGVCSYAFALYCVWSLAGRPEGAEHFVLARARVLFARRAA